MLLFCSISYRHQVDPTAYGIRVTRWLGDRFGPLSGLHLAALQLLPPSFIQKR